MAKESPAQKRKVGRVMDEFKHGELESGSGRKVRNPKQAIAIGLSEAGVSRKQSPAKNRRSAARTQQRERSGRTAARRSDGPTRKELYEQATRSSIAGRSRMSKDELAKALQRKR